MSYSPKYFTDLPTAISVIKSYMRTDIRNSVSDSDIEIHLEKGEVLTDNILEACGFDLDNLDSETKANAKIFASYKTLISLIEVAALAEADKRNLVAEYREVIKEIEERVMRRKYPTSGVKVVYKRMEPGYGRKWRGEG